MIRLTLLRHGDTARPGYLDGCSDPPLSSVGWAQMEKQTAGKSWSVIVASPRIRALQPARALAERTGGRLIEDPDWAEMDFGRWDGLERCAIEASAPDRELLRSFYLDPEKTTPPGGEGWAALKARVGRGLGRLLSRSEASAALVVTHAGPIRAALNLALAIPPARLWSLRLGYASRTVLDIGQDNDGQLWGEIIELVQP